MIRTRIAATVLTLGTLAGVATITSGTAHAATLTCKTTNTYSRSVSALGTVSEHWLTKHACGRNYTEWEHGDTVSYTGATSVFHWVKTENYPHWVKTQWRHSVSKSGTVTNTVTTTSG